MLFDNRTDRASLPLLFGAIHARFGDRLIAVGRPQPAVPGMQNAHVKIAYTGATGANPSGKFRDGRDVCIVHTAVLQDDGSVRIGNGHYDLTAEEAWGLVR